MSAFACSSDDLSVVIYDLHQMILFVVSLSLNCQGHRLSTVEVLQLILFYVFCYVNETSLT